MTFFRALAAAGLLAGAAMAPAGASDVSGAGATFPYPIYAKWAEAYKKESGITVHYQPVGSAAGIQQIQDKEVTFGGSDMPLNSGDLDSLGLVQFPTVMGGVVAVVNIEGIKAGELVLDGPTLAKIFLGEITSWNDRALRRLNPSLRLPSQAIAVVHRSDGSGSTFAFTDYLSKVSADWKAKVGSITSVDWPTGRGARGNDGVAAAVARSRRDRLCRIRLRQARQAQLCDAGEPRRQAGRARLRVVHGRCRPRELEGTPASAWTTNEPGGAARRITSATFVLTGTSSPIPVLPPTTRSSSSPGRMPRAARWRRSSTIVPMLGERHLLSFQRLRASEIKDASGKPIFAPPKQFESYTEAVPPTASHRAGPACESRRLREGLRRT